MVDATIARISGPVAVAKDLEGAHMFDVVRIGEMGPVSYTHLTLPTTPYV